MQFNEEHILIDIIRERQVHMETFLLLILFHESFSKMLFATPGFVSQYTFLNRGFEAFSGCDL